MDGGHHWLFFGTTQEKSSTEMFFRFSIWVEPEAASGAIPAQLNIA
jgi:hypothetical protein